MDCLDNPTQIIRIPIRCTGSENAVDLEAHDYGLAMDLITNDIGSKAHEILQALNHERDTPLLSRIIGEYARLVRGVKFDVELSTNSRAFELLTEQCSTLSEVLKREIEKCPGIIKSCLGLDDPFHNHDDYQLEAAKFVLGLLNDCRAAISELAVNTTVNQVRQEVESLLIASGDMIVRKLRSRDTNIRETASCKLSVAVQFTRLALGEDSAHLLEKGGFTAMASGEKLAARG